MFQPVTPKPDFKSLEEDTLKFWKERDVYHASLEARRGAKPYVFFEQPLAAYRKPGVPEAAARIFKDLFPRYKAMTGHRVLRRAGWDTHGWPVEREVEEKLGLADKKQIEEYGIARFNAKCRQVAFDYAPEWERLTDRIGFSVDAQDAYVTFTNDYIESVWWIVRQLWDKNLVYQGFKVVPYCPRCGTLLSRGEVSLGGDQNSPSPSVFVRFPLVDQADTAFLVSTDAPWSLPANVALAVNPSQTYVRVRRQVDECGTEENLILARDLMDKVLGDSKFEVVEVLTGSQLRGTRYQPLFTFLPPDREAHYVVAHDFLPRGEGANIVHLAAAFDAKALQVANDYDLPVLMTLDEEGRFIEAVTPWRGKFFKEADPLIIRDLELRGLLFSTGAPGKGCLVCQRCDTPVINFARNAWYVATASLKEHLASLNQTIFWHPENIRDGRFGLRLAHTTDWTLGYERYWGTPLPIWICDRCGHQHCVGSRQQLADLANKDQSQLDLHRPYVDEVTFTCPGCKEGTMARVPEVMGAWFDLGAMPVAQWHYPFENQEKFGEHVPADLLCEPEGQTTDWFYWLHGLSTMLFENAAYKNVVCLGPILDSQGRKMSDKLGNIANPWDVLEAYGADALRWHLYTAVPADQQRLLSVSRVGNVARTFMLTLWNVYAFFVAYANLDRWKPVTGGLWNPTDGKVLLDRWILSELHGLVRDVSAAYERYDAAGATRPIEKFVDDLSHWYLRRSRHRFLKGGASANKHAAYTTLYMCLTTVAKLLAPAAPFLAEALYRNLVLSVDPAQPESVHLADWPQADPAQIDKQLSADMRLVRKLVSLGHGARQRASRKARQPLAEAIFVANRPEVARVVMAYADLMADELNVKSVRTLESADEAMSYALKPLDQPLGQKHGAHYPKVRAALLKLDSVVAARALLARHPLTVEVDGQTVEVLPEEVEVRLEPREGLAVASKGGYLVALRTALTPDLVAEGLARGFARRVQKLRKAAGFDLADRIITYYAASPLLAKAIAAFADSIQTETMSAELIAEAAPEGTVLAEEAFDGEKVKLGALKK